MFFRNVIGTDDSILLVVVDSGMTSLDVAHGHGWERLQYREN